MKSTRLVIKVGSALIAPDENGCSTKFIKPIAAFINTLRANGTEVILVSSGAVAAAKGMFNSPTFNQIERRKAQAAAGQTNMISMWSEMLAIPCAQMLMTHQDLSNIGRFQSIRKTLDELLTEGILPIVNENDSVSTKQSRVGDNDNLSAMIATAANADTLILCSDIDGLYTAPPASSPNARKLSIVKSITDDIRAMAGDVNSSMGTGGMITKIQAVEKAASSGVTTYLINGFDEDAFIQLLNGNNPGTLFEPSVKPLSDPEHYWRHTAPTAGTIVVDSGNSTGDHDALEIEPLLDENRIKTIQGDFNVGDTIEVHTSAGLKIAKGVSNYSSCTLKLLQRIDIDSIVTPLSAEQLINPAEGALFQ
jgi:glutamate 5-kinase